MSEAQRIERVALGAILLLVSVHHFVWAMGSRGEYGFADLPIFLETARGFLETGELYPQSAGPDAYRPAAPVYKFPPLFAALLLPSARGGIDPGVYRLHWWIQLALYLGAAALLIHMCGARGRPRFVLWSAAVALNLTPFFETVERLQLETPILLLLVVCVFALERGRDGVAGAALGVAAALKLYPAFLLVYFVYRRRWIAVSWCVLAAVLVTAATLVVFGVAQHELYFFRILPAMLGETPILWTENLSPGRLLQSLLGASPQAAKRIGQLLALTLLALSLRAFRRAPRPRPALELSLLVPVMLLAMPNSWANYQMLLLLPAVVFLGAGFHRPGAGKAAVATSAAACALMLFWAPCDDTSAFRFSWPCAQTPWTLGLVRLPRALHDLLVDLRVLAPLLLWVSGMLAIRAAEGDAPITPGASSGGGSRRSGAATR